MKGKRLGTYQLTLIALLLMLLLWWQACTWYQSQLMLDQRDQVISKLDPYGNALTTALNQRLGLVYGLEAFAISEIESPDPASFENRFDIFAANLYNSSYGIRSIAVAPKGVVEYVYPLKGNEFLLDHNLLQDPQPKFRSDIQRTLEFHRLVISEPHQMRSGIFGLFAQKAVFKGDAFWGIVSMHLEILPILQSAGLSSIPDGMNVGLRDRSGQIFFGNGSVFDGSPVLFRVDLSEGYWELAGIPEGGWAHPIQVPLRLFQGAGLIIISLLCLLIYSVSNRQQALALAVQEKTSDLEKELAEHKSTEDALRDSEEKYRIVVENASEMIIIAQDGRLMYVNPRAVEISGYAKEELISRPFVELIFPEDREKVLQRHLKRLKGEDLPGIYDFRIIDRMGQVKWVEINAVRIEWGKGPATLNFMNEITERKMAEEDLHKALEKAEAADKTKSEFLANMSHEIRTPMNAVIGMTGLLQSGSLTPEQREQVEIIHTSGKALLSIIDDILDLSKIERGKMELENRPFDLKGCVQESLDFVSARAAEKGLTLNSVFEHSIPSVVLGDPNKLRQVLANLLSNAVKFTEKGGVELLVGSRKLSKEGYELYFAVKDTGIGIAEGSLDKLFLPFSQVDASITRKYSGTGLGLAISKRLVELMRGRIWAESRLGQGSTFHFTIQVNGGQIEAEEIATLEPHDLKLSQDQTLRILLAEDNDVNQKVMLQMLKKLGFKANVAANGLEVLEALALQPYDVILMDVQMPKMDGLQTAKAIRQQRAPEAQPCIIAITAYALEEDRKRCMEAGMDNYISKPIKIEELGDVLESCSKRVKRRSS